MTDHTLRKLFFDLLKNIGVELDEQNRIIRIQYSSIFCNKVLRETDGQEIKNSMEYLRNDLIKKIDNIHEKINLLYEYLGIHFNNQPTVKFKK